MRRSRSISNVIATLDVTKLNIAEARDGSLAGAYGANAVGA
jgi:hypothetical protein